MKTNIKKLEKIVKKAEKNQCILTSKGDPNDGQDYKVVLSVLKKYLQFLKVEKK